jgi:hypothetical protein
LFVFDDAAADFEVGHHLEGVHDGGDVAAGALDEVPDFGEEGGEAVRLRFGRGAGFASGRRLFHEVEAMAVARCRSWPIFVKSWALAVSGMIRV